MACRPRSKPEWSWSCGGMDHSPAVIAGAHHRAQNGNLHAVDLVLVVGTGNLLGKRCRLDPQAVLLEFLPSDRSLSRSSSQSPSPGLVLIHAENEVQGESGSEHRQR